MSIRKPKPLTARERRLFKALTQGKSQTEAAIEAGYSTPRQAGSRAVKSIQQKAPDLFARHGLDDDAFVDKCILPALNATEVKTHFDEKTGWQYSQDLVAWGPRTNTNALVARMKGLILENKEPIDKGKPNIQVIIVNREIRPHASDTTT